MENYKMKPPRALFPLFILLAWHTPLRVDSASFYVDPDWTGPHSGLPSQPWSTLDSQRLEHINAALANDERNALFLGAKSQRLDSAICHAVRSVSEEQITEF